MLTLLMGKAGSGKTSAVLDTIRKNVENRQTNTILIVPEQYSHEAERELARVCPDSMSLYAEVLSFTGLARRLFAEYGGSAKRYLDEGGKLLSMALALNGSGSGSADRKIFGGKGSENELRETLLATVEELKASGIGSEALLETAGKCGGHLSKKLRELAGILDRYEAVVACSGADSADRLNDLARLIREKADVKGWQVFVDGFSDFTGCETAVLQALIEREADLTVCLTANNGRDRNEAFTLSAETAIRLRSYAEQNLVEVREEYTADGEKETQTKDPAIGLLAENAFFYSDRQALSGTGSIRLCRCISAHAECELAASEALRLVRETGCRWRDIAVAVRGFKDYAPVLKRVFEHYGVPLFSTEKIDLFSRPLPALIAFAYEIAASNWDQESVIGYMRTGITGLSREECDELETYLFRWQLNGQAWKRAGKWKQHPEGSGNSFQTKDLEKLERINRSAEALARPLWEFFRQAEECEDAGKHVRILTAFLESLALPRRMAERTAQRMQEGCLDEAREIRRIWDLTCQALEQCEAVLGNTRMGMEDFGNLFTRMLSRYSFAQIPTGVDRVSAGDFDRMRRRNIRHLIVLGASEDRLPGAEPSSGAFSEEERTELLEAGLMLGAGESEMWREVTRIYNCLSLPSETLTMSYPVQDEKGNVGNPSLIMKQAERMFGISIEPIDQEMLRLSAAEPAFSLAVNAPSLRSAPSIAAERVFSELEPERMAAVRAAASLPRGGLAPETAERLYGKESFLSASRADTFAACKFEYFCRYGLKARPYETEELRPTDVGSFMHRIFEQTARDVKAEGGFKTVDDRRILELADRHIDAYIGSELQNFEEKTARFTFLFRRLRGDVHAILLDAAEELRRSDFEPLDFELDILNTEGMEPYCVQAGDRRITLSGVIDRVDGWEHDGKLYLRVVDYKTGKKEFRLSDVLNGTNLQMLLYLNDLARTGEQRYGKETVPAGIMYFPARNDVLAVKGEDDPDADKKEKAARRRSGLVLEEAPLLEAWEKGEEQIYLPVKKNKSGYSGDTLVSEKRLQLLSEKVDRTLTEMAESLARGDISADPLYENENEHACQYCDYKNRCGFRDGQRGERVRKRLELRADEFWSQLEKESGTEDTGKEEAHGGTESNS